MANTVTTKLEAWIVSCGKHASRPALTEAEAVTLAIDKVYHEGGCTAKVHKLVCVPEIYEVVLPAAPILRKIPHKRDV